MHQVCVVDNFESGLEFAGYLIMATCLFTQFEECLGDPDVGKRVDPRETGVAQEAMLLRDMCELIDNSSNLMVTSIANDAQAINALTIVLLYEWKEFLLMVWKTCWRQETRSLQTLMSSKRFGSHSCQACRTTLRSLERFLRFIDVAVASAWNIRAASWSSTAENAGGVGHAQQKRLGAGEPISEHSILQQSHKIRTL